jgi:hypothetical protein
VVIYVVSSVIGYGLTHLISIKTTQALAGVNLILMLVLLVTIFLFQRSIPKSQGTTSPFATA